MSLLSSTDVHADCDDRPNGRRESLSGLNTAGVCKDCYSMVTLLAFASRSVIAKPTALGTLASLPIDIRMAIFRFTCANQNVNVECSSEGEILYQTSWPCLRLSSALCIENFYTWLEESSFTFYSPAAFKEFIALLESLDWKPLPRLRHIRVMLLAPLQVENAQLDINDVEAKHGTIVTGLIQQWRQSLDALPASTLQIVFDFHHEAALVKMPIAETPGSSISINGVRLPCDKTAPTTISMQVFPGGDFVSLLRLISMKILMRKTPRRIKIYVAGLARDYDTRKQETTLMSAVHKSQCGDWGYFFGNGDSPPMCRHERG